MPKVNIHTSTLFDPKRKSFIDHVTITVDTETGLITDIFTRDKEVNDYLSVASEEHIDLRGKIVLPGFVDAHTHIFLHSYEYVPQRACVSLIKTDFCK